MTGEQDRAATSAGPRARVMVVDDERAILRALQRILPHSRFDVFTLDNPLGALQLIRDQDIDVALLDLRMPNMSGVELLERIKQERPSVEVVMMTAYATVETAISTVRAGAFDYLTKPFDQIEKVQLVIEKAFERKQLVDRTRQLERQLSSKEGFDAIVGDSPKMKDVFRLIDNVAGSGANVLVRGETGTGKELVARAIHERSQRAAQPMITVNCSALTETLLESELFGHKKGSFTGANANKKGLFEAAHKGTLFLDEVGDMAMSTQVKLLRTLQEGEVRPIGSNEVVHVDVRVIAATNVDLEEAMKTGMFREDLYWRLNVITLPLPPLRERPTDIPLLVYHFLRGFREKSRTRAERVGAEAMDALTGHRWEGNVRELANVIERASILCQTDTIVLGDLPEHIRGGQRARPQAVDGELTMLMELPYRQAKERATTGFERRYLEAMLHKARGNVSDAARRADVDRSNFRRLLNRHGMDPKDFRDDA